MTHTHVCIYLSIYTQDSHDFFDSNGFYSSIQEIPGLSFVSLVCLSTSLLVIFHIIDLDQRVIIEMEGNTRGKFKRICVFCGSSSGHREVFRVAAAELGNELVGFVYVIFTI